MVVVEDISWWELQVAFIGSLEICLWYVFIHLSRLRRLDFGLRYVRCKLKSSFPFAHLTDLAVVFFLGLLAQVLHPYLLAIFHKELVFLACLLPLLTAYVSPETTQFKCLHLLLHRLVVLVRVRLVLVVLVWATRDMGVGILMVMWMIFLMRPRRRIFVHIVILFC